MKLPIGRLLKTLAIHFAALISLATVTARADEMSLYTWRPVSSLPKFIIGVRSFETPQIAVNRYLTGMNLEPELRQLVVMHPLPNLPATDLAPLADDDFARRTLLLTNRPEDFEPSGNWRMASFTDPLSEDHLTPYALPYAYDVGLSDSEAAAYRELLNLHFPSMVTIGGADLDGTPFGLSNEHSHQVNARRDRSERLLLELKIKTIRQGLSRWIPPSMRKSGVERRDSLVGICRGSQFISLLLGNGLNTHAKKTSGHPERAPVTGEGGTLSNQNSEPVGEKLHPLRVLQTRARWLERLLTDEGPHPKVNDYHRQYSVATGPGELELAAVNAEDGLPEAFESRDARIIGLQFHPELMIQRSMGSAQRLGRKIMHAIAEQLIPVTPSCARSLEH